MSPHVSWGVPLSFLWRLCSSLCGPNPSPRLLPILMMVSLRNTFLRIPSNATPVTAGSVRRKEESHSSTCPWIWYFLSSTFKVLFQYSTQMETPTFWSCLVGCWTRLCSPDSFGTAFSSFYKTTQTTLYPWCLLCADVTVNPDGPLTSHSQLALQIFWQMPSTLD